MRKPIFEMSTGKDGKVSFQLKADHGTVLLSSRSFQNQAEAIEGIASVMRYGGYDRQYWRKENARGQFFFQLQTPSGRILGWSEMYLSKEGRDGGIMAVRRAIQMGRVLDLN